VYGDGAYPSKVLLNGYSIVDIDKEVDQILAQAEEKNETIPESCTSDTSETSEGKFLIRWPYTMIDFLQGPKVTDMEDDDTLPPNLQQMVMQALEDIRKEANVSEA